MCLNDPESCAGGDFWFLAGLTMPDWSKGRGQTKSSPGTPGWGLGGAPITRSQKKETYH